MGSTDLITYLDYVSNWESESDKNVDSLISELNLFLKMDGFEFGDAINEEFKTLTDLAMEVRDMTIASDAMQIAADAAAVASFWSFGLGMAAFVVLEGEAMLEKALISKKSTKLNGKLKTVDTDIAARINSDVKAYIEQYKANNHLINAQAPKGMDNRMCRSYLMQFMAQVQRVKGTITASIFKQYAASARIVFDSEEINAVYDALDDLNLSERSEADVKKFMNTLVGLKLPEIAKGGIVVVQGMAMAIMGQKMKIANTTIEECAESAGIPLEEVGSSAFEMLDFCGKFAAAVTVAISVIDIVLEVLDIVDVVQQCKKMCDELNGRIKENYISYYSSIQEACKKYKKAIAANGTNQTFAAKTTKKEMAAFHTKVVPASADKSRFCVVL